MKDDDCLDSILAIVRSIVSNILEVGFEDIHTGSEMGSVNNWDSLCNLRILFEVESRFQVKFDLIDLTLVRTVGDWADLVKTYKRRTGSSVERRMSMTGDEE